ncbi:hypothetical protein EIP86_010215 [Pleurotus ostreatoroseus]|nr:hypothetical protein EIP86_010215 [Pleurotus ostreatoroseus]
MPETKPILIAGAGPTGLVLALTLAKNGIPVRIIEKDSQFHVGQRGSGLQPRTLELFRFLGVADDIVNGGRRLVKRCIYEMPDGRKPARIFDMAPWEEPTPSVPYRNPWIIGQSHNEEIIRSHLEKHGVHVELNTELVGFEQDANGVTAQIVKHSSSSDVPETFHASFLVGAEGARSVVRKQLGFTFLGETRPADRILISDMEVKGISDEVSLAMSTFGVRDIYYFHSIGIRGEPTILALNFEPLFEEDHQALFAHIRKVSNRPELEFGKIKWLSEWKPNIRMANKFGEGRAFIIGDSAHVHSPTGGQGLNTGVQDAYNLAWKLSLVHKGLAAPSLLETYTEERLPVISEMLGRTTAILNQNLKLKSDGSNVNKSVRPKILHQLGVNCRWSAIVVDEQPEAVDMKNAGAYLEEDPTVLYAGDRAPEAPGLVKVGEDKDAEKTGTTSFFSIYGPTHHTVLIFTADSAEAASVLHALNEYPAGTVTAVVVLPKDASPAAVPGADLTVVDRDGYAHEAYPPVNNGLPIVVVRPDGVVGAVVKGTDSVKRYFDAIFVRN